MIVPTIAEKLWIEQRLHGDKKKNSWSPGQKRRIRILLSRQLWPPEVDFLLDLWAAGVIRAADCPKIVVGLLQRGWVERDGRTVRLSEETKLLLAEAVE
jgi:hypothetical protein